MLVNAVNPATRHLVAVPLGSPKSQLRLAPWILRRWLTEYGLGFSAFAVDPVSIKGVDAVEVPIAGSTVPCTCRSGRGTFLGH